MGVLKLDHFSVETIIPETPKYNDLFIFYPRAFHVKLKASCGSTGGLLGMVGGKTVASYAWTLRQSDMANGNPGRYYMDAFMIKHAL